MVISYSRTGLNFSAQKLMRHDGDSRERPTQSENHQMYELMLDFYGMVLEDKSGKISRSKNFRPI